MRELKAGVIGTGWVATARHIPALKRLEDVAIAAVYDRDVGRARDVAQRFDIPVATTNIDELYAAATDFVSISTPPDSHAPLAIGALEAGRHVFVEKPMAMSTSEARLMARTAERTGLQLCVSHNLLYSRSVRRAVEELKDAGAIQHIMAVQLSNPRRRLPVWYQGLPGGLFFDESPHVLYLLRRLLGDIGVVDVRARLDKTQANSIEFLEARLTNGEVDATLTMSFNAPVSEWRVTIIATNKVITLDLFRDIVTVATNDGKHGPAEVLTGSLGAGLQSVAGFVSSGALYSMNRLLYGHERIIAAFVRSVRGAQPAVRPSEAVSVVRITEDILRRAGIDLDEEPGTAAISAPPRPRPAAATVATEADDLRAAA
ncbi:MAG TPA: Gfo/Idh/MocA family oxidoreductase [Dehalococcoidia bacterium]|nr:Gfo/Idh/MocA family oxidoreductase [Dehalococcoidia bacterium]